MEHSYSKTVERAVWAGDRDALLAFAGLLRELTEDLFHPSINEAVAHLAEQRRNAETHPAIYADSVVQAERALAEVEQRKNGLAEWTVGSDKTKGTIDEVVAAIHPHDKGHLNIRFTGENYSSSEGIRADFFSWRRAKVGVEVAINGTDLVWGKGATARVEEQLKKQEPGWAWFRRHWFLMDALIGIGVALVFFGWLLLVPTWGTPWLFAAAVVSINIFFGYDFTQRMLPAFEIEVGGSKTGRRWRIIAPPAFFLLGIALTLTLRFAVK